MGDGLRMNCNSVNLGIPNYKDLEEIYL